VEAENTRPKAPVYHPPLINLKGTTMPAKTHLALAAVTAALFLIALAAAIHGAGDSLLLPFA
jgi:hypothetical protein